MTEGGEGSRIRDVDAHLRLCEGELIKIWVICTVNDRCSGELGWGLSSEGEANSMKSACTGEVLWRIWGDEGMNDAPALTLRHSHL